MTRGTIYRWGGESSGKQAEIVVAVDPCGGKLAEYEEQDDEGEPDRTKWCMQASKNEWQREESERLARRG